MINNWLDGLVKITLQDDLGGDCIEVSLGIPGRVTGFAQALLRRARSQTLIGISDGQSKAAAQLVGKARSARSHFVWRAIERNGKTDDKAGRLPFRNQGGDGGKALGVGLAMDNGQGVCLAQDSFADRNAYPLLAEIEGENGALPTRLRHARHRRPSW